LIVGEYTVSPIENPLRRLRKHSFWSENTQVDCWRIHSFSYMKSLGSSTTLHLYKRTGYPLNLVTNLVPLGYPLNLGALPETLDARHHVARGRVGAEISTRRRRYRPRWLNTPKWGARSCRIACVERFDRFSAVPWANPYFRPFCRETAQKRPRNG
jgi:hypothetical protein